MLCAASYKFDRRARRVVFSFSREAFRTDISALRKLQNTDITIRWLLVFLNSFPEKADSLKESQKMLEQIAQTKNNTHLFTVAAAMSTMITTLSQDDEKDGNVESLVNAIVNGIRLLEIHQNSLVQRLLTEETPAYRISELRKCIEKLNLVSTQQLSISNSCIKSKI